MEMRLDISDCSHELASELLAAGTGDSRRNVQLERRKHSDSKLSASIVAPAPD